MDGLQDETKLEEQGAQQQASQRDDQGEASQAQVSGGEDAAVGSAGGEDAATASDEGVARTRGGYEAALAERDAKIVELEKSIADAAKTAESAEKLRAEMNELRRQGEEQRIGFELQLSGARNVKAARALLADHGGDVEKLKAAEPWLFGAGATTPAQTGATGLPNAGTATDAGAQMRRRRKIAGIEGEEE